MPRFSLGNFELQLLVAIGRGEVGANYGTAIVERIGQQTGQKPSVGAVYTTLNRLERKGFVSSFWGEPAPERGGRRKRMYIIAAAGLTAMNRTYAVLSPIGQSWQFAA